MNLSTSPHQSSSSITFEQFSCLSSASLPPNSRKDEKKNHQKFLSQTYNLSNTLSPILRKILRDTWKRIKQETEFQKCKERLKEKSSVKNDLIYQRQNSRTPDFSKKEQRAKILREMLGSLEKNREKLFLYANLNQKTQNQHGQVIAEEREGKFEKPLIREIPNVKKNERNVSPLGQRQKIVQFKYQKIRNEKVTKITEFPRQRAQSKVSFQYMSPKAKYGKSPILLTSGEYGRTKNTTNTKESQTITFTEENMQQRNFGNFCEFVQPYDLIEEVNTGQKEQQRKRKIKVVSQLPYSRQERIQITKQRNK